MIHAHWDEHTVCAVLIALTVPYGVFLLVMGRLDTLHHRRPRPRMEQPPPRRTPSCVDGRPSKHRDPVGSHR